MTAAGDGQSAAVPVDNTMHHLPEKTAVAQLVDTNGRIRQIFRRKYGRSTSRRKRKTSTSCDLNKPKKRRVGVAVGTQGTLSVKTPKTPACVSAVKRSTRMKYEKGHYAAMLAGLCRSEPAVSKDDSAEKPAAVTPTRELEVRSGDIDSTPVTLRPVKMPRWTAAFHAGRLASGKKTVEELELRKMRTLQKKRRLTSVEKLRMKKLRDRLRKKMLLEEPLRRGRKQKLVAGMVAVAAGKRHRKLTLKSKKLGGAGGEHCYAAAGHNSQSLQPPQNCVLNQPQSGVTEQALRVIHSAPSGDPSNQAGTLLLSAYAAHESVCVECSTCSKWLSVGDFLRHQHQTEVGDTQQLLVTSQPRTLRLHSVTPLPWETALWSEFEKKQQTFDGASVKHIIDVDASVQPDTNTHTPSVLAKTPVTECDAHTTRHSKRVRKRKQLHPIERYVFSKLYASNDDEDRDDGDDSSLEVSPPAPEQSAIVVTPVVSSRTKPKLTQRRDLKVEAKHQKYGLRTSPEDQRKRRRL